MDKVFTKLGSFGPIILYIAASYLLWKKNTSFYYYQVGFFTSAILNLVLKGIFKQPRPSEDPREFNLAIKNGHRFIFKNGIPHDIFGMPSGHAQSVFFSAMFILLTLKITPYIASIYLFIVLNTGYQSVKYKYHTISQVIIGGLIGLSLGYIWYNTILQIK
mgnify:CR=1 FL=1